MSDMIEIAGISLSQTTPTSLTFNQLDAWVIWQFPISKQAGLCGAVTPSTDQHGWMPAIIHPDTQNALVYSTPTFPTPNAAADWVATV
jgi:hypothetical protein